MGVPLIKLRGLKRVSFVDFTLRLRVLSKETRRKFRARIQSIDSHGSQHFSLLHTLAPVCSCFLAAQFRKECLVPSMPLIHVENECSCSFKSGLDILPHSTPVWAWCNRQLRSRLLRGHWLKTSPKTEKSSITASRHGVMASAQAGIAKKKS